MLCTVEPCIEKYKITFYRCVQIKLFLLSTGGTAWTDGFRGSSVYFLFFNSSRLPI